MLPIAFALAVVSALWMLQHVARRYPTAPKRIPWRMRWDGRPSGKLMGKWFLWVAPTITTALIALLGIMVFAVERAPADEHAVSALIFVVCAEIAYLVAWATDRQIELARKMTYRISPMRSLRVALPMLLTVAVLLVVAARI
ncbi:MAG TPA: hypothetical protein VHS78_02045 [Candidatus Elarobacter sp.]|nr:hypothetical protein [Candidatus Elarobacter sp.]